MSVFERLACVLDGLGVVSYARKYTGKEERYAVYDDATVPIVFGDQAPWMERHLVSVHYFCPAGENTLKLQRKLKKALFEAGFTWPSVTTGGSEADYQHLVFECECEEEIADGDQAGTV